MVSRSHRSPRSWVVAVAATALALTFGAARAHNAAGFSYNYCVGVSLAPGAACSDYSYLARTYDRGWSATSGGFPCVYFKTAAGNVRGGGTVICHTDSASMCLVSSTPTSAPFVANGANSGAARAFSGNTDDSPNHTGFCY